MAEVYEDKGLSYLVFNRDGRYGKSYRLFENLFTYDVMNIEKLAQAKDNTALEFNVHYSDIKIKCRTKTKFEGNVLLESRSKIKSWLKVSEDSKRVLAHKEIIGIFYNSIELPLKLFTLNYQDLMEDNGNKSHGFLKYKKVFDEKVYDNIELIFDKIEPFSIEVVFDH
ncbi:MAG: hypothetical protein WBG46_01980 [Nonlabens sp.]